MGLPIHILRKIFGKISQQIAMSTLTRSGTWQLLEFTKNEISSPSESSNVKVSSVVFPVKNHFFFFNAMDEIKDNVTRQFRVKRELYIRS